MSLICTGGGNASIRSRGWFTVRAAGVPLTEVRDDQSPAVVAAFMEAR